MGECEKNIYKKKKWTIKVRYIGRRLTCVNYSFSKKGFNVKSFGTGDKVKLPGNAPDRPNIYDFGTTYDEIYNDLLNKDKQ